MSEASEFTAEEAVVELPRRNAAGKPLTVTIRALTRGQLLEIWKGMPSASLGAADDLSEFHEEVREKMRQDADKKVAEVVTLGVVSPRFSFGTEAQNGDVPWDGLHVDNQAAIIQAIYHQSGLGASGDAGAVLSFRYLERGGIPVREGAGGTVPAAPPAA